MKPSPGCEKSKIAVQESGNGTSQISMSENKELQLDKLDQIRRSTRRATIERRIWSQPRKEEKLMPEESKRGRKKCRPKKHYGILKSALLNRQTHSAKKSQISIFTKAKPEVSSPNATQIEETLIEKINTVPSENVIIDVLKDSSICLPISSLKEALGKDHNIETAIPTLSANVPSDNRACSAIDFSLPKNEKIEHRFSSTISSPDLHRTKDVISSESVDDESSHVSLSEALEKLIDPSTSLQAETVTIHPVLPTGTVDKLESSEAYSESDEGVPLNLKMSLKSMKSSNSCDPTITQKDDIRCESDLSSDSCQSVCSTDNQHEPKSPLNLVKSVEASPSFKFSMKCPECNMRFGTVRFLLWHLSTHEKQVTKRDELSNLLKNLAVEWDDPTQIVSAPKELEMPPDSPDYHTSIYNTPPKSNHYEDTPEDLSQTKDHYHGSVILKVPTPRFNGRLATESNVINKITSPGKIKENLPKQYMVASSPQSQSSLIETKSNQITIIPIDKNNPNLNNNNKPIESKLDKDDLVVINPNLALRIVSTSSSSQMGEITISTSCSSSNQSKNSLTILPQSQAQFSQKHTTPDILTIVPQTDSANGVRKTPLRTANGEVMTDSQVMNLVLVPAKTRENSMDTEDDDSEGSECGMVIDVEDEEPAMDPLSMCAVTMEVDSTKPKEDSKPSTESESKVSTTDAEKYKNRRYVCQFCQKRFGWSTDLKRHIILHTGERPFKCKWCPINFTRKFLLQNHMKKIHPGVFKVSDMWE